MAILKGNNHIFEMANMAYYKLVGHRDIIGKPVQTALPEVVEQGFIKILDTVLQTGEPFIGDEIPVFSLYSPYRITLLHAIGLMWERRDRRISKLSHSIDCVQKFC